MLFVLGGPVNKVAFSFMVATISMGIYTYAGQRQPSLPNRKCSAVIEFPGTLPGKLFARQKADGVKNFHGY